KGAPRQSLEIALPKNRSCDRHQTVTRQDSAGGGSINRATRLRRCPQASGNGPATQQRAPAYPALGIELLSDESVLRFYENIRQQVAADLAVENLFRLFGGGTVRQRTERLTIE